MPVLLPPPGSTRLRGPLPWRRSGKRSNAFAFSPFRGARALPPHGRCRESILDEFHGNRGCLAAADAEAGHAALATRLLERIDQGDENACAARANRVAERGRAAMDVDLLMGDAEILHREHGDAGESLVDFPQVDFAGLPASLVEDLLDRSDGSDRELRRLLRMGRSRDNPRDGLKALFARLGFAGEHNGRSTIGDG